MDFSDPALLIVGTVVSGLGTLLFFSGKRNADPKGIFIGLALTIAPMFVGSVWLDLGIAGAGLAAMKLLPDFD